MKVLVTGSSGLIGGSVVEHFADGGHEVVGVDNDMRAEFFGPAGSTAWSRERLEERFPQFRSVDIDVRDAPAILSLVDDVRPDLVVHAAAQPSHDLAASIPLVDFGVNATGTLHVLEAVRHHAPDAAVVFLSTNKVYGDAPNEMDLVELETRWDYARPEDHEGVDEDMSVDRCMHSLFGASKLAADVLVQEYGRYFGMKTACLRGGCLTGGTHSGVPLHGFLSYLVKTAVEGGTYDIIGYKGKQVRDNLHGSDVARFCELFVENPRSAVVYNLGGGRGNSCSIIEALAAVDGRVGRTTETRYVELPRAGDHICYITDTGALRADYPEWHVEMSLDAIYDELVEGWLTRQARVS